MSLPPYNQPPMDMSATQALAPSPYPPAAFPPPDAAIAMLGLTRAFGQKVAVNGLTLAVKRGEFFGFLGPNGAGKSTTIKMLVGLLRPTAGRAWVGGVDVCATRSAPSCKWAYSLNSLISTTASLAAS